jgi:hypothetical protein
LRWISEMCGSTKPFGSVKRVSSAIATAHRRAAREPPYTAAQPLRDRRRRGGP